MWLKSSHEGESPKFLFDAIVPIVSSHQQGYAIVTYRTDNKEAAALVKKIRRSVTAWFFGHWQNIMGYRLAMVQKLIESFDVNADLLARFSEFDPITLTVQMTFGDVDNQFWTALRPTLGLIKDGQRTWRRQMGTEWTCLATMKLWQ
jgi:hypothetical protein